MPTHSTTGINRLAGVGSPKSTLGRSLRTAVWHGDERFSLHFPVDWQLTVLWPSTPPPLTENQIAEILSRPAGQERVVDLCRGRHSPLVIVDDPVRPTPASRVLPYLLEQFQMAGIPPGSVRILVAAGAHGPPRPEALIGKLGPSAAACTVLIHDPHDGLVDLGKTSHGTRVWVNREIPRSDFLIGIGGIYPSRIAGFSGGSTLAMGVLGLDTVRDLYSRHPSAGWGQSERNEFRAHLDEIAQKIGLRSMISLQIDAGRNVVRVACGDPSIYYSAEVAEARKSFAAPPPGDADVAVSNAYPGDLSLISVEMRGLEPLRNCRTDASRIVLARCPEGVGTHELFPLASQSGLSPSSHARLGLWPLDRARRNAPRLSVPHQHPIWLYRPGDQASGNPPGAAWPPPECEETAYGELPAHAGDIQFAGSWANVLDAVRSEQAGKTFLRVYLYPCAPLQCFTVAEEETSRWDRPRNVA